ncbi:unnamed protein product [Trichobilharzia regenti]|nr:unnamed protein product [Trichobilharzia regenti]
MNDDPDGEKLQFSTNYSSLSRLKKIHDDHVKSSNGEIYVNGDGATSDNDNKNKTPTGGGSSRKNSLKRQNSSNSVYYNVWESEDGSKG